MITGSWFLDTVMVVGLLMLGGALGFWIAECRGGRDDE